MECRPLVIRQPRTSAEQMPPTQAYPGPHPAASGAELADLSWRNLFDRCLCRRERLISSAVCEQLAINRKAFHHTLDIVPCLCERDAFRPVDRIDVGAPRIAVLRYPFLHAAPSGIVAGGDQQKRAAIILHQSRELGGTHLGVIDRI